MTTIELASYRAHVGLTIEQEDFISQRVLDTMSAALDGDAGTEVLPPLWHYGLFLPFQKTSALDVDGHPKRGGFIPAIRLPRRMFAGSTIKIKRPLRADRIVSRVARIDSVDHRTGKVGDLVFVKVASVLSQENVSCIEEVQTIVYRPIGGRTPAVQPKPRPPLLAGEVGVDWAPTTTELFRYSAATFNGHRIHYDWRYTTEVEKYPGLVVHGPLIATRLCTFASQVARANVRTFSFRAVAPCFVEQAIRMTALQQEDTIFLRAERCDGVVAMSATAVM